MAARPIMTPLTAVFSFTYATACGVEISPFPMTGTDMARAHSSMMSQLAVPEYCWERVRP